MEQLLPHIEPIHDPRNLYASDSPVVEDPDSDEELYKSAEEVAENIDLSGRGDDKTSELDVCFLSFDSRLSSLTGTNLPSCYLHSHLLPGRFHILLGLCFRGCHVRRSRFPRQFFAAPIEQTNVGMHNAPPYVSHFVGLCNS